MLGSYSFGKCGTSAASLLLLLRSAQQKCQIHPHRLRKLEQRDEGGGRAPAFQVSHAGTAHPGLHGESFLRPTDPFSFRVEEIDNYPGSNRVRVLHTPTSIGLCRKYAQS